MKIALLGNDEIYCSGLITQLSKEPDMEIASLCSSLQEAVERGGFGKIEVLVVDLETLGRQKWGTLSILVDSLKCLMVILSKDDDFVTYIQTLLCGVAAYLLKASSAQCIIAAIRAVSQGLRCGPIHLSRQLSTHVYVNSPKLSTAVEAVDRPSSRQLEILKLASAGLSNAQIADELGIAVGTVKSHLADLYSKLEVRSRTQAITECQKRGWLSANEYHSSWPIGWNASSPIAR